MNEVDKILKDAAKITGELHLAYGYVQTPIQALSFYCQSEPSDFTRRSISLARACACTATKQWNLTANSIATIRKNSCNTALSPIDFQKHIRLQETRYILQNGGTKASQAAFDVGYESSSQFSREYARMSACRLKPTRKHFATKNEQKFKAIGLGELCKISKFHCAMQAKITAQ